RLVAEQLLCPDGARCLPPGGIARPLRTVIYCPRLALSHSEGPLPREVRQRKLRQVRPTPRGLDPIPHASASANRFPEDAGEGKAADAVAPRHLRWRQPMLQSRLAEVPVVRLLH